MAHRVLLYCPRDQRQSGPIMHAVLDQARHLGWELRLGDPQARGEAARARDWHTDGVIAYGWDRATISRFRPFVRGLVVIVPRDPVQEDATVYMDPYDQGRRAASFFLERGHRRFAALTARRGGALMDERLHGFRSFLWQSGHGCLVYQQELGSESAWREPEAAVVTWVGQLPDPCALFATGVWVGRDAIEASHRAGRRVPESIAVVAANDDPLFCDTIHPTLAAVPVGWPLVGLEAARLLARRLAGARPRKRLQRVRGGPVVVRGSADTTAVRDPELRAAMTMIAEDACLPLSVTDLCRRIGIGRRSLERRFREQLGRSPKQAIDHVRLDHARRLLADSDDPIAAVARACGFDASVFTRVFTAHAGCAPRIWRQRQRSQTTETL